MSAPLHVWTANAPVELEANRQLHQDMLDFLVAGAQAIGWRGAEFCAYARIAGSVEIAIRPGRGWPGLDELRAYRETLLAHAKGNLS